VLQVGKPSSPIRFSFDEFQAVNVSFHRPGTVWERKSRENRRFVPLDTTGKEEELPNRGGPYIFEPAIESLTTVVANELQEAVGQLACLCQCAIRLRDPIQPLLCLWAKLPWTGHHPPDDLARGHAFERRARD
jgi:hypothetical protein